MYKTKMPAVFRISADGMKSLIKSRKYFLLCITVVVVASSGCIPSSSQLSQTEKKLEGVLDFGAVGTLPACYLIFNEPHFVNRIVIHTKFPVKGIGVYISTGKDLWYHVKQFKRPISGATNVKIGRKTDIIRVTRNIPAAPVAVESIEAFGN
ncbi:MAG: hypothetical protein OXP71_17790 [Candidatus Poribacteria bacterium]|nr:hypothetical protein [Candidatus Poribacteria bacterium]